MYETFFGLKRRPFQFFPDVESYLSTDFMEEARQTVSHAVQKKGGISLIFGAAGTGKTLLMRILRKSLTPEYTAILVSNSRLETPQSLFLQLAHDLQFDPSASETVELRLQFLDFVRQIQTQKGIQGIILLFDEAQHLSPSVLEEIRLLTDTVDDTDNDGVMDALPLFRAIFAGTMDFEERLTLPNLEAFNQRIVSRCYLDSLSSEETFRYIAWHTDELRINPPHTAQPPLFTEEARHRVHRLTDGVPRLINQLCGTALQVAAERKASCVDEMLIDDVWASLQNLEPVVVESAAVSPVFSSEQIDEIVDQKRKTFQFRQLDSIEFGTLTEADSTHHNSGTSDSAMRSFSGNEYKPPFPEDDIENSEEENKNSSEAEMPIKLYNPVNDSLAKTTAFSLRRLVPSVYRIRRKLLQRYLLPKIQHRLGLFAGLFQKMKSQQCIPCNGTPCNNESDMNAKTLQEYGAAVLDARPPFVRQEPHYAYQTTDTIHKKAPYPDPTTGIPILLHWVSENAEKTDRFAVSYTEFLNRETPSSVPLGFVQERSADMQEQSGVSHSTSSDKHVQNQKTYAAAPLSPLPLRSTDPIFCASLHASLGDLVRTPIRSSLEEIFEESHQVGGSAVSLAELFRANSSALGKIEESANFKNLDEVVQRQLGAVVDRLLKAIAKIEQAAEVSEKAGQHVSQAAQFVETEIKSALPTYTELFQKLSDFHKMVTQEMITAELKSARIGNAERPKFRATPSRHQVIIERSVPTIDVEMLLR